MTKIFHRTFNYQRAKLYGYKVSWRRSLVYRGIELRSCVKVYDKDRGGWLVPKEVGHLLSKTTLVWNRDCTKAWYKSVHTEIQFSERKGNLSFSATSLDECSCCRIKLIDYSHESTRWDTIEEEVTEDQEDVMFAKACEMAGVDQSEIGMPIAGKVIYGPRAIPYDSCGVVICNISKKEIIPGHPNKAWCTEACVYVYNEGMQRNYIPDTWRPAEWHVESLFRVHGTRMKGGEE